ncbi:MAG: peptidoglycan DD-metalloendopeptidase family protein [Coriobacteriia bacterium]|nr:peptidoglycan DD-metalloendopeptidase family protein [Actinomycetota bacterium]MDZ4167642.1 peptidoglycan DD-metalloendopeptidase family protein [Coriobacteriia bacterium]
MAVRRSALGVLLCACVMLSPTAGAHGTAWVAPVAGGAIITAFGELYPGGTHRGVDVCAQSGADVCVPAAGRVTFAGRVPADGGGTCGAVTVEMPDGLRVSLLPLAEVFVTAGDELAAGETVGTVAATGDDSNPTSHLHLGLRRGDVYLDPSGLLPTVDAVAPTVPSSEPTPDVPDGEPPTASAPAAVADPVVDTPGDSAAAHPAGQPARVASGHAPSVAVPGARIPASGQADAGGTLVPESVSVQDSPMRAESTGLRSEVLRHPLPEGAGIVGESALVPAARGARASTFRVPQVTSLGRGTVAVAVCGCGIVGAHLILRQRKERVFAQ